MSKTKRISDLLKRESDHAMFTRVAQKARKPRSRITKEPPPIGHILAVMLFIGTQHEETLFVDHVDICERYTMFHLDRTHLEYYPEEVESVNIDLGRAWVYYKNDTSIQIIRI